MGFFKALTAPLKYADMLEPLRQSQGNANPALQDSPSGDPSWFDRLASIAERQAEARAEAERKAEEERREQERVLLEAQRKQQMEQEARKAAEQEQRAEFAKRNADRFGPETDETFDLLTRGQEAINQWARTPDGYRFLSNNGSDKVDFGEIAKEPYSVLAKSSALREWNYGFGEGMQQELTKRGVPEDVSRALQKYFISKDGEGKYKGQAGAVSQILPEELSPSRNLSAGLQYAGLPKPLADFGGAIVPTAVAALVGGAVAGPAGAIKAAVAMQEIDAATNPDPKSWRELATQQGLIGLNSVAMGTGFGAVEKGAAAKLAGFGVPRLAADVAARGGVNATANAAMTAAPSIAMGQAPDWKTVSEQAAIGAGMGGLSPLIAKAAPQAKVLVAGMVPEFRNAAITYATARALGADDEEARSYALMVGGATAVGKRGFREAIRSGFGMRDLFPKVDEVDPVTGVPRQVPVMGGMVQNVDEPLLPERTPAPGKPGTAVQPYTPRDLVPVTGGGLAASESGFGGAPPGTPQIAGDGSGGPNFPRRPGKRNIVPEPPLPTDDGIPYATPKDAEEYIREADTQLDSHYFTDKVKAGLGAIRGEGENAYRNALAAALGLPVRILEVVDPATKFAHPVLRSMLAAGNFMNAHHMEMATRVRQVQRDLQPLIGEEMSRRLAREALRLAPAGAGLVAGEAMGLDTESGRRALALGLTTSYALHLGNVIPKDAHFMHVGYATDGVLPGAGVKPSDLPAGLTGPTGRLAHMVVYPEDFRLTPEQAKAAAAGQRTLSAAFKAQQAFQEWAGRKVTTDAVGQEGNRLYQWFTKKSVEKALNDKNHFPGKTGLPGFAAELPIEQQRQLGINIVDAMVRHPDLRLDGDVLNLFTRDLDQKGRVMANAIVVKALTSGKEGVDGFVRDRTTEPGNAMQEATVIRDGLERGTPEWLTIDAQVDKLDKALKAAKLEEAKLGAREDWQEMPGIQGYKFAPEVLESVRKLAVERPGEFGGWLDSLTSDVRTMMFTGDLSAWTMQGYMLATRDMRAAVKVMPQVLAASIFGDAYTARWVKNNYELVRKWSTRGVVNGRQVDEIGNGARVAKVPLVHQLESRGFQNMLPVFRILMAENAARVEAMPSYATETGKFQRALGTIGMNQVSRLAQFGATYLPAAAGVAVGADDDRPMWERVMAVALGAGGTMAIGGLMGTAGKSYLERMPRAQRDALETRVAKDINRISGVVNKPQMGITAKQGQIERTYLFRSPALLRNSLILAKLAMTPGAEGAMAQMYLLQTGLMVIATGVAIKLAAGQGMDSLDPTDENSILHPRTFGKIDLGQGGNFAPSNPIVALGRAAFYHKFAEGEPRGGWGLPTAKGAMSGGIGYVENRVPDVAGQFYKPRIDQVREIATGEKAQDDTPLDATLHSLAKGDVVGALGNSAGRLMPLPLQAAAEAGVIPFPGLRTDPSYNSTLEKALGTLIPAGGGNYNPETRPQESRRRTADEIQKQFPGTPDINGNGIADRRDLTDADREKFDASPVGQGLKKFGDETRALHAEEPTTPIDDYFAALDSVVDAHVKRLRGIETDVAAGTMSKFQFRDAYAKEQSLYVAEKKALDDPGRVGQKMVDKQIWDPTTKSSRDMTVTEYLNRNPRKEDVAVDGWFALYDKATSVGGVLDFDKLDRLQAEFKSKLLAPEAAYLEQRLATFAGRGVKDGAGNVAELPTLKALEDVKAKAAASGYWAVEDAVFKDLQVRSPRMFGRFADYNELMAAVDASAKENGVSRSTIIAYLEKKSPAFKVFNMQVERKQRTIRSKDLAFDLGLQDFYERPAVNWKAAIAQQYGDHSYDELAPVLRPPTAAMRLAFARRYNTKPLSSYFVAGN